MVTSLPTDPEFPGSILDSTMEIFSNICELAVSVCFAHILFCAVLREGPALY